MATAETTIPATPAARPLELTYRIADLLNLFP
jgi:hypothetical protein